MFVHKLSITGSDNGLPPGAKPLSEPMLEYNELDP